MIKKRDEKRIPFRKLVICKCGGEVHPGFVQDVSQHGISIQTMQRPSVYRKVRIALADGQESISLDGEVRWSHEYSGEFATKPREIGIHIPRPPAGYLRLVADCSDRGQSRPAPFYEPLK
ncbi:MAG: PilZ domain-containing protein [Candidatus Aminicenantes bacterium]|nr:PilZ domain-containing protein [Candidatus Aminicenantes bacterium]